MFEESVSPTPSIWASMNSWFTPAVFFVVLNLMIGTIAISARLGNKKVHQQPEAEAEATQENPQHRQLARFPSVLQTFKSFKFSAYRSQEPANTFDNEGVIATATSDLHKTQEFDTHFTTLQQPLENEEEEQPQEEDEDEDEDEGEDEDEYEGQDQYADQTMNEIYGRLQATHAINPSTPQSPTTAIIANAASDLHKNQIFDSHSTSLQQSLENEEEEEEPLENEEEEEEEDERKEKDQYADKTMNEIYDRLQATHATNPSTPQSPTTAIIANAASDLHKNQIFDSHFTSLHQSLENEEEEEEESEEDEHKEQDQYADKTMNEIYDRLQGTHAKLASEEEPKEPKRKMKKSVSAKWPAYPHFEEDDFVEARRPATVREGKVAATSEDNEEVDSKAGNFIYNLKHQLKLQRLDSILRNMEEADDRRLSGKKGK